MMECEDMCRWQYGSGGVSGSSSSYGGSDIEGDGNEVMIIRWGQG